MAHDVNALVGSPQWWRARLDRTDQMRSRRLTMDAIAAQALLVLDREGHTALTMRRLADELNTGAASIYRHVKSREELLVLMVDLVLAEVAEPADDVAWGAAVEALAIDLRAVMLRHPWVARAGIGGPLHGPNAMRIRELFWKVMDRDGRSPETTIRTYYIVLHFTISSAIFSVNAFSKRSANEQRFDPDRREGGKQDPNEFPTVSKLAPYVKPPNLDDDFRFGVGALIAGIAAVREGQ